jgi:hypothetical protein
MFAAAAAMLTLLLPFVTFDTDVITHYLKCNYQLRYQLLKLIQQW